jgi:ATP-dependent Clp protease ATP-binding subunit ClpC
VEAFAMYENFTDQALRVMEVANEESKRLRHDYIGTEHILLGLVDGGDSLAVHVLATLNVDPGEVRSHLAEVMRRGLDVHTKSKPLTPRAKKTVEYGVEESARLSDPHIGTEHLLLALLRDPETVACQLLADYDLSYEEISREVRRLKAEQEFGPSW